MSYSFIDSSLGPPKTRPMSVYKGSVGYNERDLKVALAVGILKDRKRAAEFCEMSERNLYKRLDLNQQFIKPILDMIDQLTREKRVVSKEVAREEQVNEFRKLYGVAYSAVEEAVAAGDGKLALQVLTNIIERDHGKVPQRVETDSKVAVLHVNVEVLKAANEMDRLVGSTLNLLGAPAVEAELAADE